MNFSALLYTFESQGRTVPYAEDRFSAPGVDEAAAVALSWYCSVVSDINDRSAIRLDVHDPGREGTHERRVVEIIRWVRSGRGQAYAKTEPDVDVQTIEALGKELGI